MLAILLLLGADEPLPPVRPRAEREDCILVKGECYGMEVFRDCALGPDVCVRLGIEEADPPAPKKPEKGRKVNLNIYPACGVDAAVWAKPRLAAVETQVAADGLTIANRVYQPCDARPRIDVIPVR